MILTAMNPEEYDLEFFRSNQFRRRECPGCGRHFWSLGEWETCGEPPCQEYSFIGNSPMSTSLDLHEMRETYLSFFERRGHPRVRRYPIVARWRDDVFFTQASIYGFQPWVIEGVVEPPANPLVISQTCVRFNDIDNVGKTGRHLTFFEMCAHHAFNKPGKEVYFKDRTVELCHEFMTSELGTDPARMRYVEEWWEGGGNSGPCLEVILEGAELATLVFMQYQDTPSGRRPLGMRVVDTGYGLERITWVSQGCASAYEAVFGPVLDFVKSRAGVSADEEVLREYSRVAGMTNARTASDIRAIRERTASRMGIGYEELMATVSPLEEVYVICDHSRALAFLLNDGVVPSNVREGYFARMLTRRALRAMRSLGLDLHLADVVDRQIAYFRDHFPELSENRDDILELVAVEERRYRETLSRGRQLVERIASESGGDGITTDRLIELYDSHGLNPEIVAEFSPIRVEIPDDFYIKVAERHERPERTEEEGACWEGLPATELLYYQNPDLFEFEAEVVEVIDSAVVLDRTAFYPEGGGQECDLGSIGGQRVSRVTRAGNSVLHFLEGQPPSVGETVECKLNKERRRQLMRHHTAAHIINGVARRMLGNHAWQAGAHKSVDRGRLDITHYENLDPEQREALEKMANEIVLEDIEVVVRSMPRDQAEATYGYRLYQGGAVPGKTIRVVDIVGIDAEACGGVHCRRTGHVGPIRIQRTQRIQDGVVRIEYTAGTAAIREMQEDRRVVEALAERMNVSRESLVAQVDELMDRLRRQEKSLDQLMRWKSEKTARELLDGADLVGGIRVVTYLAEEGEPLGLLSRALSEGSGTVAILGQRDDKGSRIVVTRTRDLDLDARDLLRQIISVAGGSGGGKRDFAQGGGMDASRLSEAMESAKAILRERAGKAPGNGG